VIVMLRYILLGIFGTDVHFRPAQGLLAPTGFNLFVNTDKTPVVPI
jgi:hypothetical protein